MKRNWEGLVLKALGGKDFCLKVLHSEAVNAHFQRLRIDDGGLLQACGVHPTMWIRLWFTHEGRPHQRAYTLVDPDPAAGEFTLEFAIHDGCAAQWALSAQPGDTIDATVQGSSFTLPSPMPRHLNIAGDAASLPAINSLLDAAGDTPATLWIEYAHEGEQALPLRTTDQHTVTWVPRCENGSLLLKTILAQWSEPEDAYYWVACEVATTREINKHLRRTLKIHKDGVTALGYWIAR